MEDTALLVPSQHCRVQRVWCECRLPLHRGSRHLVTKGQRRRHQKACLKQHIPFTDIEATHADHAALPDRDRRYSDIYNNATSDLDTTSESQDSHERDIPMHYSLNEDDTPNIADWLDDIGNDDGNGYEGLGTSTYDMEIRALDMFDAFVGTPRARLKKMRKAISKHYGVNIGDPVRKGRNAINDLLGDVITPISIHCCSDGCVAYTGRLLSALQCPSCGKSRFNQGGQPVYCFQYIPLLPRLRLQYSDAARSKQLTSYRASFDPTQADNGDREDVFNSS